MKIILTKSNKINNSAQLNNKASTIFENIQDRPYNYKTHKNKNIPAFKFNDN